MLCRGGDCEALAACSIFLAPPSAIAPGFVPICSRVYPVFDVSLCAHRFHDLRHLVPAPTPTGGNISVFLHRLQKALQVSTASCAPGIREENSGRIRGTRKKKRKKRTRHHVPPCVRMKNEPVRGDSVQDKQMKNVRFACLVLLVHRPV